MIEPEPGDSWLWAALQRPPKGPAARQPPVPPPDTIFVEPLRAVPSGDPAGHHWVQGRVAFLSGRYSDALESYRSVLALRPNHRASLFNVASCLERLGQHHEAESAYRKAVEGVPAAPEANLCLGQSLLRLANAEEALAAFEHCLIHRPAWTSAVLGKAVALHKLGRLDEAQIVYAAVPSSEEGYAGVLANMIAIAAARNDVLKLREYSQELLNLRPKSAAAVAGLMQGDMGAEDYKAATQHGLRLIKYSPSSYEAWFNLGLCYQKSHHPEEASQAYTEAIKIQPDATPAHANMAVILQEHGDLSGARRELERVLELQPGDVSALWKLAPIREKDGQPDLAEEIYSQLIRQKSDLFDAAFRLGLLRGERKNYAGAAEAFEICLTARSDDYAAHFNASVMRWRLGQPEAAMDNLQHALDGPPESLEALRLRATLCIEEGDWKAASEVERRLNELGEDTALLTYNIGVLQQREGLQHEAAVTFGRSCAQRPDLVEALVNAGHAHEACGQRDDAIRAWQAALRAKPELAGDYFQMRTASAAV